MNDVGCSGLLVWGDMGFGAAFMQCHECLVVGFVYEILALKDEEEGSVLGTVLDT